MNHHHDHMSFQQKEIGIGDDNSQEDSEIDSYVDSESIMMEASFCETVESECQTSFNFKFGGKDVSAQTEISYNKGFHIYRSPTRERNDDTKRKLLSEREISIKRLI